MNSRALVIFSKPTSFLIISVLFSLLYQVPCASSKQELGWCEGRYQCGDIIAGFPFWGGDRPEHCGLSLLELHCHKNSSTSLLISDQEFSVLDVDQTSYTLTLARADQLGPFCSSTFNTTTLPPDIFVVSPTYKNLTIFHDCDFCSTSYNSNITCGNKGRISVPKGPENQCTCLQSFTVNVPSSFDPEGEVFLQKLESVLRKGVVVKVKVDEITCQECLASGGICSFNGNTQVCCKKNLSTSGISCLPKRQPSAAELHILCSNQFRCGDQYHLLYPFWIPGREECGLPDFKLECNTFFAELYIASVKFRILEANYTSRIIRLARSDYLGDLCPEEPSNDPYDKNGLLFTPDTELLTFYYDCRDFSFATPFYDPTYFRELDCDSLDGRSYYVTKNLSSSLLDGVRDVLNILSKWCVRNVSIPAFGSALKTLQESPSPYNLKKTLEQGFELGVTRDCFLCIDSGGACGYNHKSNGFVCYCNNGPCDRTCGSRKKSHGTFIKILIGSSLLAAVLVLLVIFTLFLRKRKASHNHRKQNQKALIPLNHYSYAQVKRITKSFAEVVGKGGFGTVYKGSLFDGRCVAVKVLKDLKGNGEDFINEVASMSKTSHVNIVSLLGFCFQGSKRAIISEFLENGSLDQFISSNSSMNTNWMVLYGIALGVARGIEYLHYGCKTRIVHFDIKPSNVLLDKNLCPKVSDFGLAKLCEKKESIMSLLDTRGTIGYIAPEMISRVYGSVSHKSDVYSYGMLVLEMIGAKNKPSTESSASNPSSMYFPEWIYRDLEKRDHGRIIENEISSEEEEEIVRKMTVVGLWCIQPSPLNRPPMNRVVEMMEGSLEALEIPPRPVLQQIPAAPFQESSSLLEDISV